MVFYITIKGMRRVCITSEINIACSALRNIGGPCSIIESGSNTFVSNEYSIICGLLGSTIPALVLSYLFPEPFLCTFLSSISHMFNRYLYSTPFTVHIVKRPFNRLWCVPSKFGHF